MSGSSGIEWTDHTFNPWWGCTEVSPGCDNCYARTWAARFGTSWGVDAARRTFGPKHWAEPLKWNQAAEKAGVRAKVFCASMADLFERDAPEGELERLWALIRLTPWLDWQLLTKRPQEIAKKLPEDWGEGYPNVWLGTSVESADYEWRITKLLAVPAAVKFLSLEPLLGPVDLWSAKYEVFEGRRTSAFAWGEGIGWVIVGGESGAGARPMDVTWVRRIVEECRGADCPVFVKQLGAKPYTRLGPPNYEGVKVVHYLELKSRKGGDMAEWPEDLRVREFPRGIA